MTRGTRDLLSFMLPDSGHIHEMDVENLNVRYARRDKAKWRRSTRKRTPRHARRIFARSSTRHWIEVGESVRARYWNAGHILGSASIEIEVATATPTSGCFALLFSGDIGPEHKLFEPDPDAPTDFDYVICESTYGGRQRTRATADERRAIWRRRSSRRCAPIASSWFRCSLWSARRNCCPI